MGQDILQPTDYGAVIRSWESRTPWHRRLSARIGLQGKLVVSFLLLLAGALGGSCFLLLHQHALILDNVLAEHAEHVACAVGLAGRGPLERSDTAELRRVARDFLKDPEVGAVAFFKPAGQSLAVSSRTAPLSRTLEDLWPDPASNPWLLGKPSFQESPGVGRYVQVTTPVLKSVSSAARPGGGVEILGYVTVCLLQADTREAIRGVEASLVSFNASILLLSLPLVLALVYRIFDPIRQLVAATHRITSGDLGTQVAIHRPDAIGNLARAFNEMARRVSQQQRELTTANQKLAEANLALEEKVRERTSQLVTANKRLSNEIAEKEEFIRAVSHDLNAPLRNIAGMATMLLTNKRDAFDDEVIHRLERIQKNVELETSLISELLELSQIKTQRQRVETVAIEQLVRELGGVFDEDLQSRGIRLTIDTPLPALRCERSRMRQVFQNLIDNAIKYMGEGSPASTDEPRVKEIRVGCRLGPGEAEFYVRDTGMGIDPADVHRVFQVFRRGRSAQSRNVPGRGVGLASVKSIIETYSGAIRVESRPGAGSTFLFTINGRYIANRPRAAAGTNPGVGAGIKEEELAASR